MNISFLNEYESEGRYIDNGRGLDDSRLLDAAETLVTLQTSDLGSGSNNPLFGAGLGGPQPPPADSQFPGLVRDSQAMETQDSGGTTGGGGRGRGKRGPSKRGRKKAGEGRGAGAAAAPPAVTGSQAAGGQGQGGAGDTVHMTEAEAGDLEAGEYKMPAPPPEPMITIGSMSVKGSILDDVLSEKKCQLLENPEVLEFLRLHGLKQ